jgi:hypothetical protein
MWRRAAAMASSISVRIDPPINFRKKTNRKAKRQRCKARRRARLRLSRPDPSSRRDAAWEARPLSKRQRKRMLRHIPYEVRPRQAEPATVLIAGVGEFHVTPDRDLGDRIE